METYVIVAHELRVQSPPTCPYGSLVKRQRRVVATHKVSVQIRWEPPLQRGLEYFSIKGDEYVSTFKDVANGFITVNKA